jgi:hypothetical protein
VIHWHLKQLNLTFCSGLTIIKLFSMFLYSYLKLNQSQHFIQYIHCYDWKIFKYNFYNTNRYITNRNVLFSIYSVLIGWYWCKKIILKTFMTARSCWLYYSLRIVLWLQGHVDCTTLSELFYDCKVMLTVLLSQNCFMTARSCWLYYSLRFFLWHKVKLSCIRCWCTVEYLTGF